MSENVDKQNDVSSAKLSESAIRFSTQPVAMEHLRYQGVETLMKIDDLYSLQTLIPRLQRIYLSTSQSCNASPNKERLQKSINIISRYKDDWDGEGSLAILPSVIDFVREVVDCSTDYLLEHWSIYPSSNGTLKMEIHTDQVNAGINIGEKEFSYFIHVGAEEIYGKSSNTRKNFLNVLNQVID